MLELYLYCLGVLETHGELAPQDFIKHLKADYGFEATLQEVVVALEDIRAGKVINIQDVSKRKSVCEHTSSAQAESGTVSTSVSSGNR
jgi:hypothetical protein